MIAGTPFTLGSPETCLGVGLLAVLLADMVLARTHQQLTAWLAVLTAAVAMAIAWHTPVAGLPFGTPARTAAIAIIGLVLLANTRVGEQDHGAWSTNVLAIGLGASLTASAADFVTLWLGLELMSLPGYVLAGWRARDRRAAEAGMKYVLFGGVASALTLFGISHLYGLTGQLDFGLAAPAGPLSPTLVAALCLSTIGLGYKLTVVPFHFYAPDVYQGAPAIAVAAVSIAPKIAAMAAVVRLLTNLPFAGADLALAGLAIVSLGIACFTALVQHDARRILAFSGIGHAGALLLAAACLPGQALGATLHYLLAYGAANLGAFVCLWLLEPKNGSGALADLAGAWTRRPGITALLSLFLLSLAGLPPLAGFLAKWNVLAMALQRDAGVADRPWVTWGAVALLLSTPIAAWAYLQILRAAVLALPPPETTRESRRPDAGAMAVLAICAAATLGLGLWFDAASTLDAMAR
ncbi:MAG: hypothetical protein IPK26_12675 [Planctomycetes bacterium]|nr:hypothetical protein [Planctomycetota bacterium]